MSKLITEEDLQKALEKAMGNRGNEEKKEKAVHEEKKPPDSCTDGKEQASAIFYNIRNETLISNKLADEKTDFLLTVVDEKEEKQEVLPSNTTKLAYNSQTQKTLEDGTISPGNAEFSLTYFLENVLSKVETPVSISFINAFLVRTKQGAIINEPFLQCKENVDKFSFFLLGSDFKIQLKEKPMNNNVELNAMENELFEIIDQDISKLKRLKVKLNQEVTYTDFLNKFSSNKWKMQLPFIVRNSHVLAIRMKEDETYIRYTHENEQTPRMWDMNKGLEALLLYCAKELLSHFKVPINQGMLQNCFYFGPDCLVNKRFLIKYYEVFEGSGDTGIRLKGIGDSKRTPSKIAAEHCISNSNLSNVNYHSRSTNHKDCSEKNKESRGIADIAVSEKRSIIVIGANESIPTILYYNNESNSSDKLAALEKLNRFIDGEIEKITMK